MDFLAGLTPRPLSLPEDRGLKPVALFLGNGPNALEVTVTESTGPPSVSVLRSVWKSRLGGRATPLIVVSLSGGKAAICGPSGDPPPAFQGLDRLRIEKICRAALAEPDRHAALRFLHSCIPEVETPLAGLRNEGLFATHELRFGVPRSAGWPDAQHRATAVIASRGQALLQKLGFTLESHPGPVTILRAAETRCAVAVFLDRDEAPDLPNPRFSDLSPVSYALARADAENLDYVIVSSGSTLRLYSAKTGIGTGRRGRTETFAEVHLDLLVDDQLGYLWLFFSADALLHGGTVEQILEASRRYAVDLGSRYNEGVQKEPLRFLVSDVVTWTDTLAIPLLPSEDSGEVFAQLRKAPRLDLNRSGDWRARPTAELHATNDKPLMKLTDSAADGYWPIFKGESFDIWEPDTGAYYAWGRPDKVMAALQQKRLRSGKLERSAFAEFQPAWIKDPRTLPCLHPRIAFRDVTRATDTRTVRAALLPPNIFLTNKAPYFLWPRGNEMDQAYLLGILCALPLDWYARRFVEISMNYHVLNPFPIPRPAPDSPLRQRVVTLAGRLACPDKRFKSWAAAVGVPCGKLHPDEKQDMIEELDAVAAHLYGLTNRQVRVVFETFHEGWEYSDQMNRTLKHYLWWKERL